MCMTGTQLVPLVRYLANRCLRLRSGLGRNVVSKTSPASTARSRSPSGGFKLDVVGGSCGGQSCLWNIAVFQPNRSISSTLSSSLLRFFILSCNDVCCLYLANLSNNYFSVNHYCVFVNCDVSLIKQRI